MLLHIGNTLRGAVDRGGADNDNRSAGQNHQDHRRPVRAEKTRNAELAAFQLFHRSVLAGRGHQFLAADVRLVEERRKDGQHHDDKGQGRDRRRNAIAHLLGQFDGQRRIFAKGEGGGVVVLETGEKGQNRSRGNRRFHEREQHLAERLRMGGAKVQRRLCQGRVIALQPRHQHQHAIAGDKGGLTDHRQEQPV